MSNTIRKVQENAIHEYAEAHGLSDEISELIDSANTDLHCGPGNVTDEEYPGFVKACRLITEALDEIRELWIGEDGLIADTEPDWSEECCHDWTHFEARDVKRVIVGRELVGYL